MKHLLLIAMLILLPLGGAAKKVKLSMKAPTTSQKSVKAVAPRMEELDSLALAEASGAIRFTGFDKVAGATKESFYVVNDSRYPVAALRIALIYRDMAGRMLHSREEKIDLLIPQGETRMVTIPTVDRQKSLYYHRSRAPRQGGMPFDVEIRLLGVFVPL